MQINAVTDYSKDGEIAILTINSPPVNALGALVRQGLAAGLQQALAEDDVKAMVVICEGRTFFAGADITEFGKPPVEPQLRSLHELFENADKPIISAIHGTALGGGLETALVTHYRVAVPSAKCGLPEINIGLLPGAGGTQRLPRVIGVEKALDAILTGRHIPAQEAFEMGLLDAIVEEGNLRDGAVDFARKIVDEGKPVSKVRDREDKIVSARNKPKIFEEYRNKNAKKFRGFLAPEANIKSIENAVNLPFDQGMKKERILVEELFVSTQSGAQQHVFFAQRQAAKVAGLPADTPTLPVNSVGVIGAGTMGGGIAMNFLNIGIAVTIVDTKQEALDRGISVIRGNYERSAKRGKLTLDDIDKRMALLTAVVEMEELSNCDLIIEAVFENISVKKTVFETLDAIAKPGAILATNTSYLDVDEIAEYTKRPQDVIGLHFFSPANVMRLLEIVKGSKTRDEILATAAKLAKKIGKVGVTVGNGWGFVGNRILAARQREAEKLVLEGAMPWDIDKILYDFGFAMGPFAMRDLVGLDVGWNPKDTHSANVREILNEMGRHGQKSGGGFYDYDENRKATPSPIAEKVILDFAQKEGYERRSISAEEIHDRTIYAMVNEGARILEEGIASRASDIDIIWVTGYNWPAYRGGPMYWADLVGLDKILAKLEEFRKLHGEDFEPAALIKRLVKEGKSFKSV